MMMPHCRIFFVVGLSWLCGLGCASSHTTAPQRMEFDVRQLPDVPQPVGGGFSGLIDDTLVVAGGSYFPQPPPAPKQWIDSVFVLAPGSPAWTEAGRLERPLGYGAAVTVNRNLVLAGGCDADQHYNSAYMLTLADGRVRWTALPPLPQTTAYCEGALLGNEIYVAGGRTGPHSPTAMRTFWRLDLDLSEQGWRELEPWPGPARMLACVAAQDGAIYVLSGAELVPGEDGTPVRRYLTDAYRYRPRQGWTRLAELPHAVAAAPTVAWGTRHVLVFGGDDGSLATHGAALGDAHPGFKRSVLAYDTGSDTWAELEMRSLPVTTHASVRGDSILIPSGEDRPGHRTASVYSIQPRKTE
jgi:N-acetylneuraminic acid mutarotase